MKEKVNIFIEPILEKKSKYDLKSYIKMKKLCKKLKKVSPDFDMLMAIHEFLLLIEMIYMHSNNDNGHNLFSATLPSQNFTGGAFIYKEANFQIKFVMRSTDKTINIEIERVLKSKNKRNTISFKDGEAVITNKYEEEAFQFIIACVMDGLIDLIQYYYKNKKF